MRKSQRKRRPEAQTVQPPAPSGPQSKKRMSGTSPVSMPSNVPETASTVVTSTGPVPMVSTEPEPPVLADIPSVLPASSREVLILSTIRTGGPASVAEISRSRFNFFNFNPDPAVRHTFWSLVLGSSAIFFYLTITQAGVQRINSIPKLATAKRVYYIAAPIYSLVWVTVMLQGVTMFAYFSKKGCDPLASGMVDNLNKIFPFTVLELFHDLPGLPGLFISGLTCASLSTISSGLNSLSAITYQNFIKLFFKNIKETTGTNISKLVVVAYGAVSIGCAFMLSNIESQLNQILDSFMGAFMGAEVGLFLCSVFIRQTNPKAVIISMLIAISLVSWISIGQNIIAKPPTQGFLELGPTDKCPILDAQQSNVSFSNDSIILNDAQSISYNNADSNGTVTDSPVSSKEDSSVLSTIYSISYMYFSFIGCFVVVILTLVLSCISPAYPTEEANGVLYFSPTCCRANCLKEEGRESDQTCDYKAIELEEKCNALDRDNNEVK